MLHRGISHQGILQKTSPLNEKKKKKSTHNPVQNISQDCIPWVQTLQTPLHMQMSVFNCCSTYFPVYEREEEMHPMMCIQMKYSRILMKYSVSLEFLWASHPVELLSREERQAALMSLWAASASPLNSACLFSGLCTFFGLFMAR